MTDHPRSDWEKPGRPVNGPGIRQPTRQGVIHWDGDDVLDGDPIRYLQNMQDSYIVHRGYSVGYWGYIRRDGDYFQIRGPEADSVGYNNAANAGRKVDGNANDWTASLLMEAQFGQHLTNEQCRTAARKLREWGIEDRPIPHSTIDYTACPGDAIRADITAGRLDPSRWDPTPPPVELPEGVGMIILDLNPGTDWWVAMVLDADSISHLRDGYHVQVLERGGVPRVQVSERDLEGVLRSVQSLNASPFGSGPSHNAHLNNLWKQAA